MIMQIQFLGTAGSSITVSRSNSSILIDEDLLIDAGEGTTQKLLKIGAFKKIRTILISHLHVDHFIGIFTLLWKKWLTNDPNSITIYGPPKIQSSIEKIFELTSTPVKSFPYKIHYKALDPEDSIIKVGEISVTRVLHPVYTLAYRIDRDKSICYSSDTAPLERMILLAKGCDMLIHDCSMPNSMAELAHKWTHSTPRDAAEIANKAGVKKLVVFHILGEMGDNYAQYLQDAQEFFDGEVILAQDMKKFKL
ncbi:MAG: MBL fold metallo-hydrolase [Candidatus Helarchaeota archaeon]|nr:MBL fold metallo-hydrolase [Candidatus Helarchaeota archaeon]